jgi:hypothetical protein
MRRTGHLQGVTMDLEAPLLLGIRTDTLLTSAATVVLLIAGDQLLRRFLRRGARAAERNRADGTDAGAAAETHRQLAGGVLRGTVAPLAVCSGTTVCTLRSRHHYARRSSARQA